MEVIAIAGYITDEKMHIARDYLEKTTREACGVKPEQVTSAAILALIENYCREAGVRNLQKQIEKIYCKIALQLVRQGAISESTVAEEVAEPEEAKAEGVDKSSQNTVGSDTVVETETVETITDEQTNETFVDAVTKFSDDQVQDTGDQTIDLKDKMESEELQDLEAAKNVEKVLIDSSNLDDYVVRPVFHAERLYDRTPVGVVMD